MQRRHEDAATGHSDDDDGPNKHDEVRGKRPATIEGTDGLKCPEPTNAEEHESNGHEDAAEEAKRDPTPYSSDGLYRLLARVRTHHVDEIAKRGAFGRGRGTHPFIQPAKG